MGLGSSKSANVKLHTWMQAVGKPEGADAETKNQKIIPRKRTKLARSMTAGFLSMMVVGLLCSGCLKFERQVTSPGARGVVLDAQTHAPLSGADVVVSRFHDLSTNPPAISDALTGTRPPVVTTGTNGRFRIPTEQHHELIVDWLIQPYRQPGGTLIVQRIGYQPVAIPLWGWLRPISSSPPTNFITVLLSPISK